MNFQVNKNGLAIWHTNTALTPSTFKTLFESDELLEFPADIKVCILFVYYI